MILGQALLRFCSEGERNTHLMTQLVPVLSDMSNQCRLWPSETVIEFTSGNFGAFKPAMCLCVTHEVKLKQMVLK